MKIARDSLARFTFRNGFWPDRAPNLTPRKAEVASIWGVDVAESFGESGAGVGADELVLALPRGVAERPDVRAMIDRITAERSAAMEEVWWTQPSAGLAWVQVQTGAATLVSEGRLMLPNLVAAIVASHALALNAAHLDARWLGNQGVLSAAAWLGILQRGRPALLRTEIAKTLLAHRVSMSAGDGWSGSRVLTLLAGLHGRERTLYAAAETVVADGGTHCEFPATGVALPEPGLLASLRSALQSQH